MPRIVVWMLLLWTACSDVKATRRHENERCCDGGHRIIGLSTWELK